MNQVEIAPSILAANFLALGAAVQDAADAGARRLHLDVMDGRFVPNISLGPPIVEAIRSATDIVLETHLMIVEPERYVSAFAQAGADIITVHAEVSPHLYRTIQQIHECGCRAGVAINPATSWHQVEEVLDLADLILVMTVNPGFGGQKFIRAMLPKVGRVRKEIDTRKAATELEVDGGVDRDTVADVVEAGARVLVAGTSVYRDQSGVRQAIEVLLQAAEGALTSRTEGQ